MYTAFVAIVNDLVCLPMLMCCAAFIKHSSQNKATAMLFTLILIPLLSLAGFPYTLGYISKVYLNGEFWMNFLSIGIIIVSCFKIPYIIAKKEFTRRFHISSYLVALLAFNVALISLNVYFFRLFLMKFKLLDVLSGSNYFFS